MVFWTVYKSDATTQVLFFMMDLKAGTSYYFGDDATYQRRSFNGSLSKKNTGLGYVRGTANAAFDFSNAGATTYITGRTFSRNDTSDYNEVYPKTFIIFDTNATSHLLMINWDQNGNRTPQAISAGVMSYTIAILPVSGFILAAATQYLYKSIAPVWSIGSSATFDTIDYGADVTTNFIDPNSPCWKTGNTWEHRPILYGSDTNKLVIGDDSVSGVYETIFTTTTMTSGGSCEDKIALPLSTSLVIARKQTFAQGLTGFSGDWASYETITATSSPRFLLYNIDTLRCSPENAIMMGAAQMHHFGQQKNQCEHETVDFDCEDPKYYYYRATISNDGGPTTRSLI
jgi:hypothetical protein